jgi:dUTP pyrophosphatase
VRAGFVPLNNMKVKLLDSRAKAPTVEHPGSDLGYDLYAIEDFHLQVGIPAKIRTGIAIEFNPFWGGVIKDRSSMAAKGITVSGGVIDSGYRGEIMVILTLNYKENKCYSSFIYPGDKIAQLILHPANTIYPFEVVEELNESERGEKGFGSTGR